MAIKYVWLNDHGQVSIGVFRFSFLFLFFFSLLCLGVDGGKVTILAFDTNRWGFGNIGVVGVEKYFGSLI